MRIILPALLAVAAATSVFAQAGPDISGTWARGDGKTKVSIAPCGAQLCATNVWVRDPKGHEAVGDKLVLSVAPQSSATLTGSAHDLKRDVNYSMNISVQDSHMKTEGCLLKSIVCKSMDWTRAN